jgi:hypothetical protein
VASQLLGSRWQRWVFRVLQAADCDRGGVRTFESAAPHSLHATLAPLTLSPCETSGQQVLRCCDPVCAPTDAQE